MKTRKLLTTVALALFALCGIAQPPAPQPVEPGSKGQLPVSQLPTFGQLEEGHFAGLLFRNTAYYHNTYFDSYALRAVLTIQEPAIMEADSYTLQYRAHWEDGEWTTVEADGENYTEGRGYGYDYGFELKQFPHDVTDWRVIINGGPRDGYISNTATVRMPTNSQIFTNPGGWSMSGTDMDDPKLVGSEYGSSMYLTTTNHLWGAPSKSDSTYYVSHGYYRYQWYLVDPVTYEEKAIEGATDSIYTPTVADVGYILVKEFRGDDVHCSFFYRFCLGEVALPVLVGFEYIGSDGFVLNTDYIIPNPQESFVYDLKNYWSEDGTVPEDGSLPDNTVSERKPGQYVFRMQREDFEYMTFTLNITGCALKVCYQIPEWDENYENIIGYRPWYREVQVMEDRFLAPLKVTPQFGGALLPTIVDVIGKNIDGEYVVLATDTIESGATEGITFDAVTTLGGGVFLKAHATDTTADTYYPNALTMAKATAVIPGQDEKWNPLEFVIDVQPAGAAPSEGDINGDGEVGIGDIVSVTNVMAGDTSDPALRAAADVNGDGEVGIGDIIAITNMMAGAE